MDINNNNGEQKELFEEFEKPQSSIEKIRQKYIPQKQHFITISLEKVVLVLIALIIVVVFFFSLGVEKGKHLAKGDFTTPRAVIDIAKASAALDKKNEITTPQDPRLSQIETDKKEITKKEADKKAIEKKEENLAAGAPATSVSAKYTIQIATLRDQASAVKEADVLKKGGLYSFIIPKGGLFAVCVGKFNTTKEAKSTLDKLKKQYKDCFVRNVGVN